MKALCFKLRDRNNESTLSCIFASHWALLSYAGFHSKLLTRHILTKLKEQLLFIGDLKVNKYEMLPIPEVAGSASITHTGAHTMLYKWEESEFQLRNATLLKNAKPDTEEIVVFTPEICCKSLISLVNYLSLAL